MKRHGAFAVLLVGLLAASAGGALVQQREPPVPKELLDRTSWWVERFLAGYQGLAAEELLVQTRWDRRGRVSAERRIISDYFLVRFPSAGELAELRDAVQVDERELASEAERRRKWPQLLAARSRAELAALVDDPEKHRLAPEVFGNLGLLATRFSERNRDRVRYFFAQDTSDAGAALTPVGYRQWDGASLVAPDTDAYPAGVAWIDPDDGHIGRIVDEFKLKNAAYSVEVEYGPEPALGVWVPLRAIVRVFDKGRLAEQNVYSYFRYRRLTAAARADSAETAPTP
jgi:hypothetical protein